jgi:predicted MFS family arabinose efflux permease
MKQFEARVQEGTEAPVRRSYALYVFFLCFFLMLLDYMARQVVVSMFPVLKAQWGLSDTRLGALISVVSLAVGVLSVPLAVVADRYSRVKAIALMAIVWSAATAAGALARTYEELLVARFLVGVGEAAYGAAAASLISSVFPARQRSAAIGSFMSAALFGSVLGVVVGGAVGPKYGWQAGFWIVGIPGLVLAVLIFFLRDHNAVDPSVKNSGGARMGFLEAVAEMFRSRSVLAAYAANGILVFVLGTMTAWLPTFFNRVYGLPVKAASLRAAGIILAAGVGSSLCGFLVDRLTRNNRKALFIGSAAIATGVALVLGAAFQMGPGPLQYTMILIGSVGLAGTQGPMMSAIISRVQPGVRSTALAMLAVVQNIIGLGAGGLITGILSDRLGIARALAIVPLMAFVSAGFYVWGARRYESEPRLEQATRPVPMMLAPAAES